MKYQDTGFAWVFTLGFIRCIYRDMPEARSNFDLEQRCVAFSRRVGAFISKLPKTIENVEYFKQLIRSSSSIGANYIEANSSLGYKDFLHRARIARKEAKETQYWLMLLSVPEILKSEQDELLSESLSLIKILSAIISKVSVSSLRLNSKTSNKNSGNQFQS